MNHKIYGIHHVFSIAFISESRYNQRITHISAIFERFLRAPITKVTERGSIQINSSAEIPYPLHSFQLILCEKLNPTNFIINVIIINKQSAPQIRFRAGKSK